MTTESPPAEAVAYEPTTAHRTAKQVRLSSIDALRGFAAIIVVVYHARAEFWMGLSKTLDPNVQLSVLSKLTAIASAPLKYGWVGVPIFFVLSGYCIHRRAAYALAENEESKLELRQFFLRRIWRIYPVYVVALLLTVCVDYLAVHYAGIAPKPNQDNSVAAFFSSLLTLQGYWRPSYGSSTIFWTLSIEMHLYLAYPILHWISKKRGAVTALLFSLIVSVVYLILERVSGLGNWFSYRSGGPVFLGFWFTWAVGFYLAEIESGRAPAIPAIKFVWPLAMVLGMVVYKPWGPLYGELPIAIGTAGFVAWSLSGVGTRFWGMALGRFMAWCGIFSYSLYAIHRAVFVCAESLIGDGRSETIWISLAVSAASGLVGYALYQSVERWTLRPPQALVKLVPSKRSR